MKYNRYNEIKDLLVESQDALTSSPSYKDDPNLFEAIDKLAQVGQLLLDEMVERTYDHSKSQLK